MVDEPHIFALKKYLVEGSKDYLDLFKLWKSKLKGKEVDMELIPKTVEYKVEASADDCDGCKI